MKCPHCNKELKFPDRVMTNMEAYHKPVKTVTDCCGEIVRLAPRTTCTVMPVYLEGEDDWGVQRRPK